jgi:hypothetical protein
MRLAKLRRRSTDFQTGRIMLVWRPVFCKEAIGENDIFKLSHRRGESIFVGQPFADLWHSAA